MSDLISKLEWRYATKKFDPAQVVSQDKIDFILEAIRLSATSSGLQPYECHPHDCVNNFHLTKI